MRDRLSLRGLLIWLTVLGLACVGAVSLAVGVRSSEVSAETDRAVRVYDPAAEDISTLALANSDMERGLTLYVLGGYEIDLRPFVDGERRSALALDSLEQLVGADPGVGPQLRDVEQSREAWLAEIARPAIQAKRSQNQRRARDLVVGNRGMVLYDRLVLTTERLGHTLNEARSAGFTQLRELSTQLRQVVLVSVGILLLAFVAVGGLLFSWVLAPLNDLRRQIRHVARRGAHEDPIVPTGPTELAAVGRDAESMRRRLVAEIDEARSARQALRHRAPLVAAIRRELSMPTDPVVPGVWVHGEVRAAEGVLAGDWWDCVAMPSGEAALIVTDIAGHGPEAGVAAMRIKHLMGQMLASGSRPQEAITLAARSFTDEVGRFATVAVVCVDPTTGLVDWANGGHMPPVVLKPDGTIEELGRTGPLLSWLGGPWGVSHTTLSDGAVLLAFSDGLVESRDGAGQQLDVEGLVRMYRAARDEGAGEAEAVRRTLARARQRSVDWDRDDVTLVALTLTESINADGGQPNIPTPRPERHGRR